MCRTSKSMTSGYVVDLCNRVRDLERSNARLRDLLASEDAFSASLIDEIYRLKTALHETENIALQALVAACLDCDAEPGIQAAKLLS